MKFTLGLQVVAYIVAALACRAQGECPSPFVQLPTGCYFFSDHVMSWWDAGESCRQHNAVLATVETPEEDTVLQVEARKVGKSFWLGATDMTQEGKWIWHSNQQLVLYTGWGGSQPSNGQGKEHCLMLYNSINYKWNDAACELKFNYICKKNEESAAPLAVNCHTDSYGCPAPFAPWLSGCLYYSQGLKANFTEADEYCRALHGHLVEIHSESEWLQLKVFLLNSKFPIPTPATESIVENVRIWMGASDGEEEGSWKWVESGKSLEFTIWSPNQPDDFKNAEDCLELRMNALVWNDNPCHENLPFICQMKPTATGTVTAS